MFILFPVILFAVFVFLGYCALWSSYQNNTPKGISQFGKILAIVLFVIAGLVIVIGPVLHRPLPMAQMMDKPPCCQGMMHHRDVCPGQGFSNRTPDFMDKEQRGIVPKENIKKEVEQK